jgi:hypothetical protein
LLHVSVRTRRLEPAAYLYVQTVRLDESIVVARFAPAEKRLLPGRMI